MDLARFKWGARALLVAAFMMLIETACSQSPPPSTSPQPQSVKEGLAAYEGKGVVVRFHTTDGVTYVTTKFASTDSSVVINEILRDPQYFSAFEAKLYGKDQLTPPPADVKAPVEIPIREIYRMDRWEPRSVSSDMQKGALVLGAIVVGIAIALAVIIHNIHKDNFEPVN
ncbi:MAG TPA: hypothetical protein VFH88_06890 [Candidatus Krumholzibacteria bacterium]|nr:hypothetical protein [Candidatus Krumholzibacteria bacterium]